MDGGGNRQGEALAGAPAALLRARRRGAGSLRQRQQTLSPALGDTVQASRGQRRALAGGNLFRRTGEHAQATAIEQRLQFRGKDRQRHIVEGVVMDAEQEVGARAVAGDDQQQACRRLVGEVEDSRALTAHAILQQPLGVDGVARQQALQGHRMRRQRMRLRPVDARFDTPAQRHMPFQQLAQGLFDGVGRGADYAQVGQQVVGGVLRRQLLGHPQAPFGEAQPGGAGARLRLVALGRGLAQQFQQGLGGRRATGERLQRYASGQSLAQRREQVHRPQGIAAGGVEALSGARRRTKLRLPGLV